MKKSELDTKESTQKYLKEQTVKTVLKSLGQTSFATNSEPSLIDVQNDRILRIRPFHYDERYTKEELNLWKIEKNGRTFELLMKGTPPAYQLAYKKRVYSLNRIRYPLKRVDWDPNGERNPQNRGKSKYKRISWDEATDLIASEIRRVQEKYGPNTVLCQGDGHGETKTIHGPHGCQIKLMRDTDGYTLVVRNVDSWEGWTWGAQHMWGTMYRGLMVPINNLFIDITDNTDMLVHIGCDLETTPWGFYGQFPSQVLYYWTSIGKKQVFICPDLNYSAAIHADKWIPILPNTDAALLLAIAYTWITESTYDEDYIATHAVGFDKFEDYVLGKEDEVPKTPEWASPKCGIPEWTIKALARQWGTKVTSTIHFYGGSYIRGPYSHEPARLEVCLLGMQGLGKPGVHQYSNMGRDLDVPGPERSSMRVMMAFMKAWTGYFQRFPECSAPAVIPKCQVHHAILNPPVSSWGSGALPAPVEDQFVKYTYPEPKEEGGTEIHLMWVDNPCRTACWNCGYDSIKAFRDPKLECIIVQHPWLENDTVFADIILPINTKLEEEDIANCSYGPIKSYTLEKQAIDSVGESMSDYEAVGEVAKKMGLYEKYTEGRTIAESIRKTFEDAQLGEHISWEEFEKKQQYVPPINPNWRELSPGLRRFYEDPENNPLGTPSGKLEFYSERLAQHFPDDKERPPSPKWIEKGITHDERLSSERTKEYPLLLISNHGRWRTHAQDDDITWLREIMTCKVKGPDGYMYEPVWLHPSEAAKRGIENGDIVKMYNERGIILGGALVWERLIPGAAYIDHGARIDLIASGPDEYIDRGGSSCLISPTKGISDKCWGMATSGFLVEVARVEPAEMEEWRKQYPEAFEREYDPADGLRFNAWVEESSK
jgi:anaerobic selenocysteine-containing dehydrogenase